MENNKHDASQAIADHAETSRADLLFRCSAGFAESLNSMVQIASEFAALLAEEAPLYVHRKYGHCVRVLSASSARHGESGNFVIYHQLHGAGLVGSLISIDAELFFDSYEPLPSPEQGE